MVMVVRFRYVGLRPYHADRLRDGRLTDLVNTGSLEPMIFILNASNAHVDRISNANRLTASDGMVCAPAVEAADPDAAFPVPVFGEPPPPPLVAVWPCVADTDSLNEFIRSFGLSYKKKQKKNSKFKYEFNSPFWPESRTERAVDNTINMRRHRVIPRSLAAI